MMRSGWRVPVVAGSLVLASCAGGGVAQVSDLPADGETLFAATVLGGKAGCITCHSLEAGTNLVGPPVANMGSIAAERVPGQSAEEYLRQAIVDPDAYIVEGYSSGVMPGDYVLSLTNEQIEALVEYMEGL